MISLILAIVGIIFCWINSTIGFALIIASFILGINGMKKKEKYAKAGAIIAGIILVLNIIVFIVTLAVGVKDISGVISKSRDEANEINEKYED